MPGALRYNGRLDNGWSPGYQSLPTDRKHLRSSTEPCIGSLKEFPEVEKEDCKSLSIFPFFPNARVDGVLRGVGYSVTILVSPFDLQLWLL